MDENETFKHHEGQSVTFHDSLIEHYCMIIKPKKAASDGTIHYTTNEIAGVINKALNMLQNITNFYNGKDKDSYAKILSPSLPCGNVLYRNLSENTFISMIPSLPCGNVLYRNIK